VRGADLEFNDSAFSIQQQKTTEVAAFTASSIQVHARTLPRTVEDAERLVFIGLRQTTVA
jgi:hypothetical protein